MRTLLLILILPAIGHAQTTTTIHFDYSDGQPVVVKRESRDYGYIFIKRGDKATLEMGPRDSYYGHRSRYYYGRAYRGYNRGPR